jgi:thiol-disulfide isomerase/thioredoxin
VRLAKRFLGLALALASAAQAATVVQTAPADIGSSLRDGVVTVVLFWSPDPRCGYCLKEDRAFDALAKGYGDNVVFRRVQWSPWTAFPTFDLDISVRGIPHVYVFLGRQATAYMQKQMGGDAAWVKAQIDNAVAGRLLQLYGNATSTANPSASPATPPTPEDAKAFHGLATSRLLEQGVNLCTGLNARLTPSLESGLAQWRSRHKLPAMSEAQPIVDRVGAVVAEQLVVEADKRLAGQLKTNNASLAGCTELADWLRKDPP